MWLWDLNKPALISLAALALLAAGAYALRGAPPAAAHHLCANTGSVYGPFDIQTYEAADYRNTYARTLELAGFNQLFPEMSSFALPELETGGREAGSGTRQPGYVPPVILKAIAYIESNWAQASFSTLVDYGETGPVLVSHDCGYGLMQVTTEAQRDDLLYPPFRPGFPPQLAKRVNMFEAIRALKREGVKRFTVACTHGIFAGKAIESFAAMPEVEEIVTTDTIAIPPAKRLPKMTILPVAGVFGEAIRCNALGRSVGPLFAFWPDEEEVPPGVEQAE